MADEKLLGKVAGDVADLKAMAVEGQEVQVPINQYWDPSKDKALDGMRADAAAMMQRQRTFFILYLDPNATSMWPVPVLDRLRPMKLKYPDPNSPDPEKPNMLVKEGHPPLRFTTEAMARSWVKLLGLPHNRFMVVEAISDFPPEAHIQDFEEAMTQEAIHAFLLEAGFERYDNSQSTRAPGEEIFIGWRHTEQGLMLSQQDLVGHPWRRLAVRLGWL